MNTNSIATVTWFIFEIYRDPVLLARVKKELDSCLLYSPNSTKPGFDINKLCSQPLIQSIYAETLRLRVAMFVTRTPDEQSYDLGPWKCPPKMDMVLSSRNSALNPNIWNAGTTEDPHPLDTFWADRFLIYPDDPTSGPLKKEIFPNKDSRQEVVTNEKDQKPTPSFSMEGVTRAWIPFGGGQRMCPGRHFAKQELIGTLAVLMTNYDIELRVPEDKWPDSDLRLFPFGGLPPNKKIPFSIRRKST